MATLPMKRLIGYGAALLLGLLPALSPAQDTRPEVGEVRQAWQLLDYISIDYASAVRNGQVAVPSEYAEMQEFAATVRRKLGSLPATAKQADRLALADRLAGAIAARAAPEQVATIAHALADELLVTYAVQSAPKKAPDVAAAAPLYATYCSACHGALGRGDGPAASNLNPPPIAFTDARRAAQRSPLALYQAVSQGLAGTSMVSFTQLSEADRWALAFYVGGLAYSPAAREQGEALWRDDPSVHRSVPSLDSLSQTSEAELARRIGASKANVITAYLRAQPEVLTGLDAAADPFATARQHLSEALQAYRDGDFAGAQTLALSAYLDGVEPVEPTLAVRDRGLMQAIEGAMSLLRASIKRKAPIAEVVGQTATVTELLDRGETVLRDSNTDSTTAFIGSFTILVREGLEALLIVIAMIAFLRKAERRDVLPYVHAGWLSALAAGGVTWGVATYFITISGAKREVTEGLSALFSAVVLLSVGIWMHQKSLAGRWQVYLQAKLSAALTRRSALFLFLLAFVAVYREVFETILFFAAMWSAQNSGAIIGGLLAGTAALALIALLLLRFSTRLPISTFFSLSSLLVAVLAVVLTGKGIAALQEAGWVGLGQVPVPRIEWLGVYPSWQSLLGQVAIAAATLIGFRINASSGKVNSSTSTPGDGRNGPV